jgi:hypothetical protein
MFGLGLDEEDCCQQWGRNGALQSKRHFIFTWGRYCPSDDTPRDPCAPTHAHHRVCH